MSVLKIVLSVVVAVLTVVQLIPIERTNPPTKTEILAPSEVKAVLEGSCFDCHSNRTRWPWYAYVAPSSWYVVRHVNHGREHLNLTEWPLLDPQQQQYYLAEMKEMVEENEMPLDSYLLLHWDARLSDAERALLLGWIDSEITALSAGP